MSMASDGLLSLGVFRPVSGSISASPLPPDDFLHLKTTNTTAAIRHNPPTDEPTDIPIVSGATPGSAGAAEPVTSIAVLVGSIGPTGPAGIGSGPLLSLGFGLGSVGSGFGSTGTTGLLASSISYYFNNSVQVGATVSSRKLVTFVLSFSHV